MLTIGKSSQTVSRYCVWWLNVCKKCITRLVNYVSVIGGIHLLCYGMVVVVGSIVN